MPQERVYASWKTDRRGVRKALWYPLSALNDVSGVPYLPFFDRIWLHHDTNVWFGAGDRPDRPEVQLGKRLVTGNPDAGTGFSILDAEVIGPKSAQIGCHGLPWLQFLGIPHFLA